MKCTKCMGEIPDQAKFCPVCGKKVVVPKPKKTVQLNDKLSFSVAEAAAAVGVSNWFMYEEIKRGAIGYAKLHGRKVIPRWDLEGYLKKNEVPARNDEATGNDCKGVLL